MQNLAVPDLENAQTSSSPIPRGAASEEFSEREFLNVAELDQPKQIPSLMSLWHSMFIKSATENLKSLHKNLVQNAKSHQENALDQVISETDVTSLYLVTRELHIKIHLEQIDKEVNSVEQPRALKKIKGDPLESQLILQSFLDYLRANGPEEFAKFINTSIIRLVSTVHPNETERNTNLMHYTSIQEKFIDWKRNFESLSHLQQNAPEFRIRRETLNQLRREIKAEIEGLWQSDQMRKDSINVQNEAKRITERYKVIFKAFPTFVKFVKHLAIEAFWRYQASLYFVQSSQWKATFLANFKQLENTRENKVKAIRKTFLDLHIEAHPPRITTPIIEFGTWKGGDRDGNPFVVASFTNQTFIEQKEFVLRQYVETARLLVDKLTPSTSHIAISEPLQKSLAKDKKLFPYLTSIKPHEPYRAKMRYIQEKLENTLLRVSEVKKQAGETIKPLLGLTLPGPTGYNRAIDLQNDLDVLYESLLHNGGKAQARSLLQDFHILVTTFKLHMTAIDFRQTSEKNTQAVVEFLNVVGHPYASTFLKMKEEEKSKSLLELLLSEDLDIAPWTINSLSKISKDTFESFLIFADAAQADPNAVGKFIISMCQNASDILTVLFLMKINGMLETSNGEITRCPFDVTGLFETIEDLIHAPRIVEDLLSMKLIRNYIVKHRESRLTVMLGYSDSVRDGSSFTSDAQIANTTIKLLELQDKLNKDVQPSEKISLVFYRGRGDTLPRGYGGSIEKALMSQIITTKHEDHTEQNRYLRRYATFSSALDHLHRFYSAHLSSQLKPRPQELEKYLEYFEFFGKLSQQKWLSLVREEKGGKGKTYFAILNKYSILPHLPRSNFASRPVARGGVTYNIDTIRAIPFTMALAQMREFTSAFYGTGSGFDAGSALLSDPRMTTHLLVKSFLHTNSLQSLKEAAKSSTHFAALLRSQFTEEWSQDDKLEAMVQRSNSLDNQTFLEVVNLYNTQQEGIESIAKLLLDIQKSGLSPLQLCQEMYNTFTPFRFSLQNKETALIIRNKQVVDEYTRDATEEEKALLEDTEKEAQLTRTWILKITGQDDLEAKTMTQDFKSHELYLLHKIQSKFMRQYAQISAALANEKGSNSVRTHQLQLQNLSVHIQMSILAISEALGFGG